jgi:hypothetical protein
MAALTDSDEVEIVIVDKDGTTHQRVIAPPR